MNLMRFQKIRRPGLGKAFVLSLLVCGLLIAVDQLSIGAGFGSQRVMDDVLGGLIAGVIVYLHECRRLQHRYEKDRAHELANHHIRNALQLLTLVQYEPEKGAQVEMVDSCVRRIDWTLREVLPGKSEEAFWDATEQSVKEAKRSQRTQIARRIRTILGAS